MKPTLETMTVGQLKAYLEEFPDSAKVVFAYPGGDYWRTELVAPIRGARYANASYSPYSRSYRIDEDGQEVLVLEE